MHLIRIFLFVGVLFIQSCQTETTTPSQDRPTQPAETEKDETKEMAAYLLRLNDNGNPEDHYHWNMRRATLYRNQLASTPNNQKIPLWYRYCTQLLNAGETDQCIKEIEEFIEGQGGKYETFMTESLSPILELLALAYLRKGEVENCQNNHNEYSCILPLRSEAFHTDKSGSEKAVELYAMIYQKFPQDRIQWLLNLAQMTLGNHPDGVSPKLRVYHPNWSKETKSFPAFKEVAMGLGIAEDGLSGGVCYDDFNNDGLIDVFMTSYGMTDQCKLFLHTGSGYRDATVEAGLSGIVSGLNCLHADYNNDGHKDILILRGGWLDKGGLHPNSLLHNNGDGTFRDVTKLSGLFSLHPTQTAAWADVNRDGWLDLFIGNESKKGNTHACELFINQKNGTFKEASAEHGLGGITKFVKGVTFGDINNDQWPDLFISAMGGRNLLFKNVDGQFQNIADQAGVQEPIFSFPCWFWDVNQDGYEDLFVSSYDSRSLAELGGDFVRELKGKPIESERSRLLLNNGDETFSDQTATYGLDKSFYAMGANFGDLDNDGWLDCYIGTGSPNFNSVVPNRMFRNKGGKSFEEVTSAGRFGHIQKGHGVGFADYDNDGDQDIYAVMGGAFEGDNFTNVCFQNPGFGNNWVVIRLEGSRSNRSAIGARIELTLNSGRVLYHTVNTGGTFGASSLEAEIGLGQADEIRLVTITWPSGDKQTFNKLSVNRKYQIKEGQAELGSVAYDALDMEYEHHHRHQH